MVLKLLIIAGLDRARESPSPIPGQIHRQYPPNKSDVEISQSAQLSTTFEHTSVRSLESLKQRLSDMSARIGGGARANTLTATAAPAQRPSTERRKWADVPLNKTPEYSLPLAWDDFEGHIPSLTHQPDRPTGQTPLPFSRHGDH